MKGEKVYAALRNRIARNLARERRAQRLTFEELGRRSGLHWRHVQKVEAGDANITLLTIARLVDGLGVDAEVLFQRPSSRVKGLGTAKCGP